MTAERLDTAPPPAASVAAEEGAGGDHLVLPEPPGALRAARDDGAAVAWSEPLTIRTYDAGEPSDYPMYLDHRVYQGSSGKVYPIPFTETVSDEAAPREWQAIHLENRYVRLVVLPELGGRIHIGYDKTTGYDFFYRNNVIKPALVGLAGPWVSGGVEFNWPQHHRPATYLPVETTIENGTDGSVTVWCHDHDPFARMSAQHGVRLRPDSSVVELTVRLHNRTEERQTFLWWANVAARVNDDYQSFFPEDVRYVADHARRALTAFPEADRDYYGVDYPVRAAARPGADRIDYYANIPVPTSYMIVDSDQDFFGGYDHSARAGFVHWAERRLSPGKKQWTWGNSTFGHAWDAQLTDEDGPYVELMAGVYTDNQPDFSWLLPGETKVFSQYWYPLPALGAAHQATPDAAVHVDRAGDIVARFAVTAPQPGARLRVLRNDTEVAARTADLVPGGVAAIAAPRADGDDVSVELRDREGRLLVRWAPSAPVEDGEPWVATEPPSPEQITSVDELYLTGLHLAQFRHPTRSPLPYWHAALERDPGDVRTNLAIADRDYRSGKYASALEHVDRALDRLTRRNANPTDAEGFYLRGLVHRRRGETLLAERDFGKAGWDGAWAAAAGFALAQSLACRGQNRSAIRVLDTLDGTVGHDTRRIALRVILLRRNGQSGPAQALLDEALRRDPLDAGLRHLNGDHLRDAGIVLDIAIDLRDAGQLDEAIALLVSAATALPVRRSGNVRPIAFYLAAAIERARGDVQAAGRFRALARAADRRWAFPHGLDAYDALADALDAEPDDAIAHSLIGMLLYACGRRTEASRHWKRAIDLGLLDPVLYRNAALAAYNVDHDDDSAWDRYETAADLAPDDARIRYEQDQLAIRRGDSDAARLARLSPIEPLILTRDDFTVEYIHLLNTQGRAAHAHRILMQRAFHPWEGGEGRVTTAWDETLTTLGLPEADPPSWLGEARAQYVPPVARHEDGVTDYFATSLPELLLFFRENDDD